MKRHFIHEEIKSKLESTEFQKNDARKKIKKAKNLKKDFIQNKYIVESNSLRISKHSQSFRAVKRKKENQSFKREAESKRGNGLRAEVAPDFKAAQKQLPRVTEPSLKSQSDLHKLPNILKISKQKNQKMTQRMKNSYKDSKNYKNYFPSVSSRVGSIRNSKVNMSKK